MSRLVNFGSLCIDWVYQVPNLVAAGETISSVGRAVHPGGKGLNQSIGIMVNYLYDLSSIEENHDAYFDQGEIAMSRTVAKWLH